MFYFLFLSNKPDFDFLNLEDVYISYVCEPLTFVSGSEWVVESVCQHLNAEHNYVLMDVNVN